MPRRADIEGACRLAHCEEFILRFPEGYETVVGERGVKLSGGQRQRVSIARAILAEPRILILDEATSSLDSESEEMIQDGLNRLRQGRTTFVIAHRLSTIRSADQILVLEGGEIVERGTHAELLALDGRYRQLYDKQYKLETNRFINPGEDFTPEPPKVSVAQARGEPVLDISRERWHVVLAAGDAESSGRRMASNRLVAGDERVDDIGIEMRPAAGDDHVAGLLWRQRVLVGAGFHERVVDIHHGQQPAGQGDRRAPQASRVARTVPPLVVRIDDLLGNPQHVGVADARELLRVEDAVVAEGRMRLHLGVFGVREIPGFVQHVVGDADLADVVQRRQRGDEVDALGRQDRRIGRLPGQRRRQHTHVVLRPAGVERGGLVKGGGELAEGLHDEALRLVAPPIAAFGRSEGRRHAVAGNAAADSVDIEMRRCIC